MPAMVQDAFQEFADSLLPSDAEIEMAESHYESVRLCLESNLGLERLFRSGSFGNGTSVRGYSDVDLLAVFPADSLHEDSKKSAQIVRDVLNRRYGNTPVRRIAPAVRVPFARPKHEVVPAWESGMTAPGGHKVYFIADPEGGGGWTATSPEAHNQYVSSADERLGGMVKPLIRLVKAWKYLNNLHFLSSFYLELHVAQYSLGEKQIWYSFDMNRVLALLCGTCLDSIRDPVGISGYIRACSTPGRRAQARSALLVAGKRARVACKAEEAGAMGQAFRLWNLLYTGHFPRYTQ